MRRLGFQRRTQIKLRRHGMSDGRGHQEQLTEITFRMTGLRKPGEAIHLEIVVFAVDAPPLPHRTQVGGQKAGPVRKREWLWPGTRPIRHTPNGKRAARSALDEDRLLEN